MRLYHSTSLLLPDATVLTMGGGVPGPETNLNAEIYYPSYLFARRRRRSPSRPTISAATTAIDARRHDLRSPRPTPPRSTRVTLVKMGSVTHSVDMDKRFLELPFTSAGSSLDAELPDNPYRTPPGYYMVFISTGGSAVDRPGRQDRRRKRNARGGSTGRVGPRTGHVSLRSVPVRVPARPPRRRAPAAGVRSSGRRRHRPARTPAT